MKRIIEDDFCMQSLRSLVPFFEDYDDDVESQLGGTDLVDGYPDNNKHYYPILCYR